MKQQQPGVTPPPTTWYYRAFTSLVRTQFLEHTGSFEGALLKARRLAQTKFRNWERGKGPDVVVINAETGKKTEMRL